PVPAPKKAAFSFALIPTANAQKKSGPRVVPQTAAPANKLSSPSLINRLTGNGTVQVGTVIYDQAELTNVKSNVVLDHGVIRMAPFTAQVFGGSESGNIVVDMRPTPATYSVTTKLDHVDANQLLSSVSSVKKTLYGMLAANT